MALKRYDSPDKVAWLLKIDFVIYQLKYMLWVLKRAVSIRWFF